MRRTRLEIDRQQLQSLRLTATDDGHRLNVDVGTSPGGSRLEIARAASESERAWLFRYLVSRYWPPGEAGDRPPTP